MNTDNRPSSIDSLRSKALQLVDSHPALQIDLVDLTKDFIETALAPTADGEPASLANRFQEASAIQDCLPGSPGQKIRSQHLGRAIVRKLLSP